MQNKWANQLAEERTQKAEREVQKDTALQKFNQSSRVDDETKSLVTKQVVRESFESWDERLAYYYYYSY
jgi:hypothetical protein